MKKASNRPVTPKQARRLLSNKLQSVKRMAMGGWRKLHKKSAIRYEIIRKLGKTEL